MKRNSSGTSNVNRTASERAFADFSSPIPNSHTGKPKNNNISKLINRSNKYLEQTKKFFSEYVQRSPKATFPMNTEPEEPLQTAPAVNAFSNHNNNNNDAPITLTERNGIVANFFSPRSARSPAKNPLSKSARGLNFAQDYSNKNMGKLSSKFKLHKESLVILDITCNKLKHIPEQIYDCTFLKILKVDNNLIKKLDDRLFNLKLEVFSISHNFLEAIPEAITQWKDQNIKLLNLSHNQITELPEYTADVFEGLQYLHINNNPFLTIPVGFKKLVNLHELSFDWFKYVYEFCCESSTIKLPELKGVLKRLAEVCEKFEKKGERALRFFDLLENITTTHKFNLKRVDSRGRTLLHDAALQEDIGIVRAIISVEPDLMDILDEDKHTPLSLAIKEEKYFSAKILMFNGTDLNIGGGALGCCLHLGVLKLQFYLVKDLVKYGADVNQQDEEGNTPLHYLFSIYYRDPKQGMKILEFFLDQPNINPNLKNKENWCPVHLAVRRNHVDILKTIINYNKSIESYDANSCGRIPFNLSKKGSANKYTCLHLAAQVTNEEIIRLLVENGVNYESRDIYGKKPIDYCIRSRGIQKYLRCIERDHLYTAIILPLKRERAEQERKKDISNGSIDKKGSYDEKETTIRQNFEIVREEEIEDIEDDDSETLSKKVGQLNNLDLAKNTIKMYKTQENEGPANHKNEKKNMFLKKKIEHLQIRLPTDGVYYHSSDESDDGARLEVEEERGGSIDMNVEQMMGYCPRKIQITPNNIKKIERFQKYYNFFSMRNKNQSKESSTFRFPTEENLDTPMNSCDIDKIRMKVIPALFKRIHTTLEFNKDLVRNYVADLVDGEILISKRLYLLNNLKNIQRKLMSLVAELYLYDISSDLIDADIFDSIYAFATPVIPGTKPIKRLGRENSRSYLFQESIAKKAGKLDLVLSELLNLFNKLKIEGGSQELRMGNYFIRKSICEVFSVTGFRDAKETLGVIIDDASENWELRYEAFHAKKVIDKKYSK